MSLAEMMIPTLRVMQTRMKGKKKEVFAAERCEDLKGLDKKKREEAQKQSHKYRQRMIEAYGRITKDRVFAEG